jgi:hypothetical protein
MGICPTIFLYDIHFSSLGLEVFGVSLVVERKEKGNKEFTSSSFPPLNNKNEHFKSAFNIIMKQNLTKMNVNKPC